MLVFVLLYFLFYKAWFTISIMHHRQASTQAAVYSRSPNKQRITFLPETWNWMRLLNSNRPATKRDTISRSSYCTYIYFSENHLCSFICLKTVLWTFTKHWIKLNLHIKTLYLYTYNFQFHEKILLRMSIRSSPHLRTKKSGDLVRWHAQQAIYKVLEKKFKG